METTIYTEKELCLLKSQAKDLCRQLEGAISMAVRAVSGGDQEGAARCMKNAGIVIERISQLGSPEHIRIGRPRATVSNERDMTLGRIRNALRMNVPAGTLASELGISESTFRRRMRKAEYLSNEMWFSEIP